MKTLLALLLLVLFGMAAPVRAQEPTITACRDPRFLNPIRIEFRNIPLDFFVWNSDATSWGYWAQGVGMYTDLGVMIADALDVETDGYAAGTASLVVYGDHPYTITGDADTVLCDVATSPVQDDNLEIVVTAEPTEEPAAALPAACPALFYDSAFNRSYCYTPVASGIIPIPPAP